MLVSDCHFLPYSCLKKKLSKPFKQGPLDGGGLTLLSFILPLLIYRLKCDDLNCNVSTSNIDTTVKMNDGNICGVAEERATEHDTDSSAPTSTIASSTPVHFRYKLQFMFDSDCPCAITIYHCAKELLENGKIWLEAF